MAKNAYELVRKEISRLVFLDVNRKIDRVKPYRLTSIFFFFYVNILTCIFGHNVPILGPGWQTPCTNLQWYRLIYNVKTRYRYEIDDTDLQHECSCIANWAQRNDASGQPGMVKGYNLD